MMMTDEQKSKVAQLRAAIAAGSTTKDGAPQEVRSAAVALKVEVRRSGTTAREVAVALGVHQSTLCRWEREPVRHKPQTAPRTQEGGRGAGFRVVQVAPLATTPASLAPVPTATTRGIRVAHAPSGLVVDGLDVETLAALLRRMS